MSSRKFHALFVLGMMILAAMFTGGCGGSGGSDVSLVEQNPSPTPITSQDTTPEPSPTPTPAPVTSQDTTPSPSPVPIISSDPTPTQFTVTFDSYGGSEVSAQIVNAGSNAEVPDEPYKDESSFMGWYPSEGFAFRFDFSTPISRDITLYAKWWDSNDISDSDNDGMPDLLEMTYGTDPHNHDTDDDGLTDWDEMNWLGYNPLTKDTDGNGVNDGDEDADEDGLTNILEGNYGTNMIVKDTDHDDLSDYDEVMMYKTDPTNPDTDGDGVNDGLEIALGSDPLKAETSFTTAIEADYTSLHPEAADISVKMTSSADAAGSLSVMPAVYQDSPFVSRYIPGYITAWVLNADASFDTAEITFTLGTEAEEINADFQPAIYCLDEDTGIFRKVEGQRIEGRKIIAQVQHFSIYALLNSRKFDEVWSADIRPPSAGSTSSEDMRLDIVFVIDCSGSMSTNDPSRLAVELPKNFIDKLRDSMDKAAAVTFTSSANILHELTDDKEALKSALDTIGYYGGTDGTTGIKAALDVLDSSSAGYKYIIFLTDGEDNYYVQYSYDDLIQRAKDNGIIIYTIGMGSAKETVLRNIASGTGGVYYKATAGTNSQEVLNLEEVYKQIADEAIDMTTDSNHDGITDYYTRLLDNGTLTINGVPLFSGVLSMDFTDSADWDGDGLKNGEEISIETDRYGIPYISMKSNPLLVDSDFDGYSDPEEINNMGTSPMKFTMLPGDFNQLMKNSEFPAEYVNYSIPGSSNGLANVMEGFIKFFAGDKQKQAREAFIDYFYNYSTTTEVLSRDAEAAGRLVMYQDIVDGINLASSILKFANSASTLFSTVNSGQYTLSGRAEQCAKDVYKEADKITAKMLGIKKKDVDRLNQLWLDNARASISEVRKNQKVSAFRDEMINIQSSIEALASYTEDFKEAENGTQLWKNIFEHSAGVFDFFATGAKTLATFNKIELPCKWEWLKKAADAQSKYGNAITAGFSIVLDVADGAAQCLSVAKTYGQIEANYAEYQKYLDLLKHIENNNTFPDYVRDGAAEISGMFNLTGEPDWDEFNARVTAAQKREINEAVFKSIIDVTGVFFPVVTQIKFVYDVAVMAIDVTGVTALAKGMVEAEIYYSIADGSITLFNKGTKMVAGYFESIKENTDSGEAGKYAVQLAQARIIGLNSVKNLALGAKLIGWIANKIIGRSDESIRNEYNTAINNVYNIAKKCGMVISENLPMYSDFNTK